MGAYLIRRLLLVIPTLFGIIAINFFVVQFAPGGPVEQMIAELKGHGAGVTSRMTGAGGAETMPTGDGAYRGRGPLARLVSNLQLLPRVLQLRISRLLQLRILSACALLWTAALL